MVKGSKRDRRRRGITKTKDPKCTHKGLPPHEREQRRIAGQRKEERLAKKREPALEPAVEQIPVRPFYTLGGQCDRFRKNHAVYVLKAGVAVVVGSIIVYSVYERFKRGDAGAAVEETKVILDPQGLWNYTVEGIEHIGQDTNDNGVVDRIFLKTEIPGPTSVHDFDGNRMIEGGSEMSSYMNDPPKPLTEYPVENLGDASRGAYNVFTATPPGVACMTLQNKLDDVIVAATRKGLSRYNSAKAGLTRCLQGAYRSLLERKIGMRSPC